jgi:hypothetical protein
VALLGHSRASASGAAVAEVSSEESRGKARVKKKKGGALR